MTKEMTQGKPLGLILNFAWPLILGSILQQGYSLVDAAIVGHYLGLGSLAAVGASSSVIFLILGFCNGCCGGFGIPVAQRFGARDYKEMRRYVRASLKLSAVLSVCIAILTSILCSLILKWMRTPEDIFQQAYSYLLITFIGIPCTMFYNLLASIIRALGDSRTPFYFLLLASVLNVFGDYLLIVGFGMGAGGAALSTLIAQGVSTLMCFRYMKKHFPVLNVKDDDIKGADWEHQKRLLSIGAPMGLQFSITAIGSIMLQSSNNALGTICVSAFTVGMRIKMFFISPLENLGIAMATYCGQNLGAGKTERIKQGLWTAMMILTVYVIVGNLIMFPMADDFARMFVDSSQGEVIDKVVLFLRASAPAWIFLGTLCTLRYSIQGLGFTRLSMVSGVFEMVARVAVSLLMVPSMGFLGVSLGDPTAWLAAFVFLVPAILYVYKRVSNEVRADQI